jgi:hypothetical protein
MTDYKKFVALERPLEPPPLIEPLRDLYLAHHNAIVAGVAPVNPRESHLSNCRCFACQAYRVEGRLPRSSPSSTAIAWSVRNEFATDSQAVPAPELVDTRWDYNKRRAVSV